MRYRRILVVFGTRPEAIKMAPVVRLMQQSGGFEVSVCVSAQHRQMLDQVLKLFEIYPNYDLDIMRPNQTLSGATSAVLSRISNVLDLEKPDLVLVHGDTLTAFTTALACFYQKIPVAHVEAGLRTGDITAPWPEEMNRRFIGQLASLHFAPTNRARQNLLAEGVSADAVWVTGNTVIDALKDVASKIHSSRSIVEECSASMPWLSDGSRRIILVTGHRRENFGEGIESVCRALRRLAGNKGIEIVYPVHPNPNVMRPVYEMLGGIENIHLIEPMEYLPFVYLLNKSYFVLTDSGGVQEEAPSLGKPVLLMRESTERPEAVTAGTVKMVGVNESLIVNEAERLLNDDGYYSRMSAAHNPYGDGFASKRIVQVIAGNRDIHEFS